MDKEKTFEMYVNGVSVRRIARKLDTTKEEIKKFLNNYYYSQVTFRKNRAKYTSEFEDIVCKRYQQRCDTVEIADDFNINCVIIVGILRRNKLFSEYMSPEIKTKWNDFDKCPSCGSDHVNDLFTHYHKDENNKKSIKRYCFDCGTEFGRNGRKNYIVDWAYVD